MRKLQFLVHRFDLLAVVVCVLGAIVWMMIAAYRYYHLDSGGWDSAVHAQTLWSLSHGSMFNSLLNASFLVEHATLLSFLLVPLYLIWPDPLMLQYLKIIVFFAAAHLFFQILRKKFTPGIALSAMIAFMLAPANIAMLSFAFNYEPFSIPLIFLIFKAFEERNYKWFIGSCFLLAMVKEQMPLVVMGFGIFAGIMSKENKLKWGMVPLLMGWVIFIIEVFVLIAYARQDLPMTEGYYWIRYQKYGQTPTQIILYLLSHPGVVFQQLTSSVTVEWYKGLLDIWGALGLFSPQVLLPAVPLFVKNLFSNRAIEQQVTQYYYAATFTPFIFLATFVTLDLIRNQWRQATCSLTIAAMFLHAFIYMPHWFTADSPVGGSENLKAAQKLIKQIPPDASVLTTDSSLTPLANRHKVYQMDSYLWGYYQISQKKFVLPPDTQYVLVNLVEYLKLFDVQNSQEFLSKISDLNFSGRWTLQQTIADTVLWARNDLAKPSNQLIDKSMTPPVTGPERPLLTQDAISLLDMRYPKEISRDDDLLPMTFYWKGNKPTQAMYKMRFSLKANGKTYYQNERLIGSVIYPSHLWKQAQYITEQYTYLLPTLKPGRYGIEIQIFDTNRYAYDKFLDQWVVCEAVPLASAERIKGVHCRPVVNGQIQILSKELSVF